MILESGIISASNTDLLSTGRLNALPYNGRLTLEFLSNLNDATNYYTLSVQLPNGDVPIDQQVVPGCNPSLAGVLDERQLLRATFPATQGGHFVVSLTETGTAICTWRAVLSP